jgi:hypothetical protein
MIDINILDEMKISKRNDEKEKDDKIKMIRHHQKSLSQMRMTHISILQIMQISH